MAEQHQVTLWFSPAGQPVTVPRFTDPPELPAPPGPEALHDTDSEHPREPPVEDPPAFCGGPSTGGAQ